jgi:hypothetical protein
MVEGIEAERVTDLPKISQQVWVIIEFSSIDTRTKEKNGCQEVICKFKGYTNIQNFRMLFFFFSFLFFMILRASHLLGRHSAT